MAPWRPWGLPWVVEGWHGASGMPADEGVCSVGLGSSVWVTARETPHWLFPWQHHSLTGMESLGGLEPGAAFQLHTCTKRVRGEEEVGVGKFYFIFP